MGMSTDDDAPGGSSRCEGGPRSQGPWVHDGDTPSPAAASLCMGGGLIVQEFTTVDPCRTSLLNLILVNM